MNFNDHGQNESWQSGIKFVEEKNHRKLNRFLAVVLLVFFSGGIGGVIGGYYVKNNYEAQMAQKNDYKIDDESSQSNSPSPQEAPVGNVEAVGINVGPAVVGIDNNIKVFGQIAAQSTGSGIIFDKRGYILTNYHVVENSEKLTVYLPGKPGESIPATLIGADPKTDIAVIKIEVQNLPVAKLGDSSKVRAGSMAIAIGNPLGQELAGSITVGYISAVNRKVSVDDKTFNVLQTDAAINHGNSGGALCNINGEVIGINTLKNDNAEGIGFAIPINEAKPIIESLMNQGYVSRPYIGISYTFIDSALAKKYNYPVGAYVADVKDGSGAKKAGLIIGDVITDLNGVEIQKQSDISDIMSKCKVGDKIKCTIWRNSKSIQTTIEVGDSKGAY